MVYSMSKSLKSFTYTNIITNGNFPNTTGWVENGSTFTVSNNVMSVKGDGALATAFAIHSTDTAVALGNSYNLKLSVRVTNANCSNITIYYDGSTAGTNKSVHVINTPTQNEWYDICIKNTLPVDATGAFKILVTHTYASAAIAKDKIMEMKQVMAVDLTALFGAGNEPSAADCANIFKFVDGTKQPSLSNVLAT